MSTAVEAKGPESLAGLHTKSMKRTFALFSNHGQRYPEDFNSQRIRLLSKVHDEYEGVRDLPLPTPGSTPSLSSSTALATREAPGELSVLNEDGKLDGALQASLPTNITEDGMEVTGGHSYPSRPGVVLTDDTAQRANPSERGISSVIASLPQKTAEERAKASWGLVEYREAAGISERFNPPSSSALANLGSMTYEKPQWHAPWKLMRVIAGHTGWVRSLAVDSSNEWFVSGSGDRTIKVWDLASGVLKLTLTGHISTIRGLAVSSRHPYLFSVGEDKTVKCWDLEQNKVVRQYHGHLSAVYSCSLHPTIDVLVTGGRDSTIRVWDIRTKAQVFVLSGHTNTVCSLETQAADPQIVSGSMDSSVRLWDLAAGRCQATLTNHKKSVRSIVIHPKEFTFASGAPDNIKQWQFPDGKFLKNLSGHNSLVNAMALNQDDVLVSAADNGSIQFWDWKTGHNFQQLMTTPQTGSLESEAGIYAVMFDKTGTRLITAEADKTIKVYKEDETATEESHPVVNWRQTRHKKKY